MTPLRSDPAALERFIVYVQEKQLPILTGSREKLLLAVSDASSTWRRSPADTLVSLVLDDAFLALRFSRDVARPIEASKADMPASFRDVLTITGTGIHYEYTDAPSIEFDWPPEDLDATTLATMRGRMVDFSRGAVLSARQAVQEAAALNYGGSLAVNSFSLMLASADLALALAIPRKLHAWATANPEGQFVEAVQAVAGIRVDEFRSTLATRLNWPDRVPDDPQGTITALCHAHSMAWRTRFPMGGAASATEPSNILRFR